MVQKPLTACLIPNVINLVRPIGMTNRTVNSSDPLVLLERIQPIVVPYASNHFGSITVSNCEEVRKQLS